MMVNKEVEVEENSLYLREKIKTGSLLEKKKWPQVLSRVGEPSEQNPILCFGLISIYKPVQTKLTSNGDYLLLS